jgi:hypothetical protein
MPFVTPQQNQPGPQPAQQPAQQPAPMAQPPRQPAPMGRGGMNVQSMSPFQGRFGMQGGGQPFPRYGGGPLGIMQNRQQPYGGGGYAPPPRQIQQMQMQQMMRMPQNPYMMEGGRGGGGMPPSMWNGDAYDKGSPWGAPPPMYGNRMEYASQMNSNRPQQGNYVGEGVYADGTPMPAPTMSPAVMPPNPYAGDPGPEQMPPAFSPAIDAIARPGRGGGSRYY